MEAVNAILTLGRWPQSSSQPEPIQWLALGREGDTLLCLSRLILDWQPCHREGAASAGRIAPSAAG